MSLAPAISAGGRFVAFTAIGPNLPEDVFVHDLHKRRTVRVSVSGAGAQADQGSFDSTLSTDGRFVAFDSFATNLVRGDTNGFSDIFVVGPLAIQP